MKIVVEGITVETTEIYDIVNTSGPLQVGFTIKLIDKPDLLFYTKIGYDSSYDKRATEKDRYERLMEKIKAEWEKDKPTIPIFKL